MNSAYEMNIHDPTIASILKFILNLQKM